MRTPTTLRLRNGTRVVLVPNNATAAATVMVLCEVGSRYETLDLSGSAHFIEHMMFKGTARRPQSIDISRDLDAVGADYNAFTSKDSTEYYIRLQAERLPLAVDMLEDMLFNSLYRPEDIQSERKVIHEEIRMYEDNPALLVEEMMEEELFRGSPLAGRINGTVETMEGISREALVAYRDRYYVPSRTVIAVAGKFDRRKVLVMLEEKFGGRRGKRAPSFERFTPGLPDGPRVRIQKKETEQVQLVLGWPAYGFEKDAKLAALTLLGIILGGTMSSRLFMFVREREGLCYSIKAGTSPYQDTGTFAIESGLSKARLDQAMTLIMREVVRIRDEDVTDEELRRAKEYVKGKTALRLEESANLADWYARQELLMKKIETPKAKIDRMMRITAADLRKVAREILRPETLTIAVIGPYDDPAPFAAYASML